jgi:hypothetical protein
MDTNMTNLADVIQNFWAYKAAQDSSSVAQTSDLFKEFSDRGAADRAAISTFASIVQCPYRIVNIGMGHRPRFSRATIGRMNKGTRAHQSAENEIKAKAEASVAKGGPPDWKNAPKAMLSIAAEELLEAPEVRVALMVDNLDLRGRADGLLRSDGMVVAVERKPHTKMYHPASTLQSMSYAIGGCLLLKSETASSGAKWLVSNYSGDSSRGGSITENVCEMVLDLGQTYAELLRLGFSGGQVPELPGPAPSTCARCEFRQNCRFRAEDSERNLDDAEEPVWLKYANRNKVDG